MRKGLNNLTRTICVFVLAFVFSGVTVSPCLQGSHNSGWRISFATPADAAQLYAVATFSQSLKLYPDFQSAQYFLNNPIPLGYFYDSSLPFGQYDLPFVQYVASPEGCGVVIDTGTLISIDILDHVPPDGPDVGVSSGFCPPLDIHVHSTYTIAHTYFGTLPVNTNLYHPTAGCQTAATPKTKVYLVDPFLLGQDLSNIDLTQLYRVQNFAQVQAKGLVADNTSAAIAVIQTNDCTNDVTFTTTNSTTLLPWQPNFGNLNSPPAEGTQSLIVPAATLLNIGGLFYAAALVQAPVVGALVPSFTTDIIVTAQQGTQTARAQMAMVPPPVILVHGLWGDNKSLAGVASYLSGLPPYSNHPELLQVLCYSKYFAFDAVTDPLSKGGCEQTSKDAIRDTISKLRATLNGKQIVGSRVDVVAHSMGGLAARNYASQDLYTPGTYRSLLNRQQGEFHEVVTLNTPELGSNLATFLVDHSNCTSKNFTFLHKICSLLLTPTLGECFAKLGQPLAAPAFPLITGAVYSLVPSGPSLQNPALSGPNIAEANWDAVSSNKAPNSALARLLNGLIAAIYPQTTPACAFPRGSLHTVDAILANSKGVAVDNDAIVTVSSQVYGAQAGHSRTFQGLSHTGLPAVLPGSTASVLDSPDVDLWVWCLLSRALDSRCVAGPSASLTQASASKTSPASKNAVPMPHIEAGIDNWHDVDRLTFRMPTGLELGTPSDLAVNTGSADLPELRVAQFSEALSSKTVPVAISRVEGSTVHLSLTPEFFGNTRFVIAAFYRDGGYDAKEFTTDVNLPSKPPTEFHPDALPFVGIRLDLANPSFRLQPWAIYANIPGRVYLDTRYVSYSIAPSTGAPVVSLDPNGTVHGLRPGTATIIGRFGSLTDQVRVTVHADANH